MRIKLFKTITFKNKDDEQEQTDYIYIKKPTIGDLTKKQNIGIFSSILHEVTKCLILGQKTFKDSDFGSNETNEEDKQKAEDINNDDSKILELGNMYVASCSIGGYTKIEEDLLNKGSYYFDRFLFVDEEETRNINNNLIKTQLEENGELLDLYKIMLAFFLKLSLSSQERTIEL